MIEVFDTRVLESFWEIDLFDIFTLRLNSYSIQMKNHNAEHQKRPFPSFFTTQDTEQENNQDIIFTMHETEQVSIQVIVLFFKTTYNNRESEEIP